MTVRIPRWVLVGVAIALAMVVGGVVALTVRGHGSRPAIVATYDCAHLQQRPSRITFACRGGNIFADGLRWKDWGERSALGHGAIAVDDCEPDCADGKFRRYPIDLIASRIRLCPDGRRQYTRIGLSYPSAHPSDVDPSDPIDYPFGCDGADPAGQ